MDKLTIIKIIKLKIEVKSCSKFLNVFDLFDHHQSKNLHETGCFYSEAFVRYVIPVPMGNKVRAKDWTCLLSSGWKTCDIKRFLYSPIRP